MVHKIYINKKHEHLGNRNKMRRATKMEARVASVRSTAPSALKKALSFGVVELALRDDDAVRSHPPARGQQWSLQQCFVPEMVEQLVAVPKGRHQERDPAADCRAGCRSAPDLVRGIYRNGEGCPSGADL